MLKDMQKINDSVFGELEFNEREGYWIRKIFLNMWGGSGSEFQLDLMVKCGKDEIISDVQRVAYNTYLLSLKKLEAEIPNIIFSYYKDHYEEIESRWDLDDDLKIDVVDENVMLSGFGVKSLFIDRNGNYGWLMKFIWDDYPISVVSSDDKIRIHEEWVVLVMDYDRVDDEAFGDMVYDRLSWKKWEKRNINGLEGEWLPVVADAYLGNGITSDQRECYLKYKENEEDFFDEVPNALMTYYLENYDYIDE